jgi:ParB family transcriptional regulator, chromosome partitioning protein
MSEKKPALGRGLADLLGQSKARAAAPAPTSVPINPRPADSGFEHSHLSVGHSAAETNAAVNSAAAPRNNSDDLAHIPLEQLQRGKYQPRVDMRQEALEELAISIRNQGIIQPIVVRQVFAQDGSRPDGFASAPRYEIIAGERRWRAAQIAGLTSIPALIRRVPDEAAIAMALIENIQREDLNPLEEARALERLIAEFGVTHQQAADAVGRSRATVSNLLRLLELAPEVSELVERRQLEMGHARALLPIPNKRQQLQIAQQIIRDGLSVRQTEALVRQTLAPPVQGNSSSAAKQQIDPNIRALQQDLADRLGAKVLIQQETGGKGRLTISYNSLDELDGILSHIK